MKFRFPQLHDQLPWFLCLLMYSCVSSLPWWNLEIVFWAHCSLLLAPDSCVPPCCPDHCFVRLRDMVKLLGVDGSRILIHKVLVATCQDVKVPKELRHHFLKILLKENFLLPHTTVLQKRSVMRWCTCQDEDISFWPVVCFWYLTFAGAFNVVETSTGAGQRSAHVGFKRKHILQGRKHPRPDHMDS